MNGEKKGMCMVHKLAWLLLTVGGLNWGLVGAFNYNLVDSLLGMGSGAGRALYVLVGLSALAMLAVSRCCGVCDKCGKSPCQCSMS